MKKGVRREPTLDELRKKLAHGLKGNLLPFSIAELKRQIAEREAQELPPGGFAFPFEYDV